MQVTSNLFLKYIKGYKYRWKNFDETNFGETNFGEKIFGEDLRDLWESFAKKKTTENFRILQKWLFIQNGSHLAK